MMHGQKNIKLNLFWMSSIVCRILERGMATCWVERAVDCNTVLSWNR